MDQVYQAAKELRSQGKTWKSIAKELRQKNLLTKAMTPQGMCAFVARFERRGTRAPKRATVTQQPWQVFARAVLDLPVSDTRKAAVFLAAAAED